MPDLNSLPPSRSPPSASPSLQARSTLSQPLPTTDSHLYLHQRNTPSPRSSSISLAAAATVNAADMSRRNSLSGNTRGSPRIGRGERRRSNVAVTLSLNESTMPVPGELSYNDHRINSFTTGSPSSIGGSSVIATGDPHHHHRAPSLGEIHQELEQEQEAQVVSDSQFHLAHIPTNSVAEPTAPDDTDSATAVGADTAISAGPQWSSAVINSYYLCGPGVCRSRR